MRSVVMRYEQPTFCICRIVLTMQAFLRHWCAIGFQLFGVHGEKFVPNAKETQNSMSYGAIVWHYAIRESIPIRRLPM